MWAKDPVPNPTSLRDSQVAVQECHHFPERLWTRFNNREISIYWYRKPQSQVHQRLAGPITTIMELSTVGEALVAMLIHKVGPLRKDKGIPWACLVRCSRLGNIWEWVKELRHRDMRCKINLEIIWWANIWHRLPYSRLEPAVAAKITQVLSTVLGCLTAI